MESQFGKVDGEFKDGRTERHRSDEPVTANRREKASETRRREVKQLVREITIFLGLYRWLIDAYVSVKINL